MNDVETWRGHQEIGVSRKWVMHGRGGSRPTLTATGGVGKTRLALRVAEARRRAFTGGALVGLVEESLAWVAEMGRRAPDLVELRRLA